MIHLRGGSDTIPRRPLGDPRGLQGIPRDVVGDHVLMTTHPWPNIFGRWGPVVKGIIFSTSVSSNRWNRMEFMVIQPSSAIFNHLQPKFWDSEWGTLPLGCSNPHCLVDQIPLGLVFCPWTWLKNMEVSQNWGVPLIHFITGFSIVNWPFWGSPMVETPMSPSNPQQALRGARFRSQRLHHLQLSPNFFQTRVCKPRNEKGRKVGAWWSPCAFFRQSQLNVLRNGIDLSWLS